jgi:hypothetical protein
MAFVLLPSLRKSRNCVIYNGCCFLLFLFFSIFSIGHQRGVRRIDLGVTWPRKLQLRCRCNAQLLLALGLIFSHYIVLLGGILSTFFREQKGMCQNPRKLKKILTFGFCWFLCQNLLTCCARWLCRVQRRPCGVFELPSLRNAQKYTPQRKQTQKQNRQFGR